MKRYFSEDLGFIVGEDTADRILSPHGLITDGEGKRMSLIGAMEFFYDSQNEPAYAPLHSLDKIGVRQVRISVRELHARVPHGYGKSQ